MSFSMVTDLFSGDMPPLGESDALEEDEGKEAPESEGEKVDLVGETKLGENELCWVGE